MKKTNTRVRRNGGSKSASVQPPKKPEAASPESTEAPVPTAERFTGLVKQFDPRLGFGFIQVLPEVATKLGLNAGQDLYFHSEHCSDVAVLAAGDCVEFQVEKSERGPRAVEMKLATPKTSVALVFQDVNEVELNGFDYSLEEFVQLQRAAAANGEHVMDFVKSAVDARLNGSKPTKYFSQDLESAVNQSVALLQLLDDRNAYCETLDLGDTPLGNAFKSGLYDLVTHTQNKLIAMRDDYFASKKSGVHAA